MKYDTLIRSPEHAEFCLKEAVRRYDGKIIRDDEMFLVEDDEGVCHTDAVLRALSFYSSKARSNGR
jgi:hypothetical protein